MRICFISHLPWKGGAERALLETIDALSGLGVECRVVLPFRGPLLDALRMRGVPTAVIPFGWWVGKGLRPLLSIVQALAIAMSLIPIALRVGLWRCDVLYTNTICTCVGALAARLLKLPHVWSIHEFGLEDHGLVFLFGERRSIRLMERLSCLCIVNSYAVARKYSTHIQSAKLRVIYQSVTIPPEDLARATRFDSPGGSGGLQCIMVGKLHERKGQADAIRAIGGLGTLSRARLVIVGDGRKAYVRQLRKLVRDCGLEGRVVFLGYTDSPGEYIARSDVLLMCSRAEAFGRATVEAMVLGTPVIGASSGGTPELIRDGWNGLLYSPGNLRELGERILLLERNPQVMRAMGRSAQSWAAQRFAAGPYAQILKRELDACAASLGRGANAPLRAPRRDSSGGPDGHSAVSN